MSPRGLGPGGLALAGLLWATTAHGQQEPVQAELEWRPPAEGSNCIDDEQLRAEVEARLGRQVFTGSGSGDLKVSGGIERQPGIWQAQIRLATPSGQSMGERELQSEHPDCSTLDDSLALVLAVMLDIPKERVPPPPDDPLPVTTPVTVPAAPVFRSKLRVPKHTEPKRAPWRLEVGLAGVASLGLLPSVALGSRAHLAVLPPGFPKFGLDFAQYRSVDEPAPEAGAGANFAPLEGGVFICPLLTSSRPVFFEACLVQHVGRLRVEGYGFDDNEIQSRAYLNVGIRGTLGVALVGPLSAALSVNGEVPVLRETFRYGRPSGSKPSLFRMAPALLTGQIGLVAQFW